MKNLKNRITTNLIIRRINFILMGVVLFSCSCLLIVFIQTLCCKGWHLALNIDGVKGIQSFWLDYLPLIKLLGCSLTIWIASYNLVKYLSVETVKALAKLREMLNSEEKKKIHTALFDPEDKKPISSEFQSNTKADFSNAEFFDYIGTIELGAIMVRRGVISIDEFYNQFGYRVENLWANQEVRSHINKEATYYKDLNFIIQRLIDKGYLNS
ncbi:hypothetical protein [uncultured Alistipes sp.]|uniref:hypothetical protein n=1 Tax=Alistipes sp. TaxID=1872444 RepID=UPI00272D2B1A|nr:hypothetical protein [uncultured Alistipes sp.]